MNSYYRKSVYLCRAPWCKHKNIVWREVIAAAAIGNPGRFFGMLRAAGLVVEARTLPDHAWFTPALAGVGQGRPVLLTEKDAVKCRGAGWEDAGWVEVTPRIDAAGASALVQSVIERAAGRQESCASN